VEGNIRGYGTIRYDPLLGGVREAGVGLRSTKKTFTISSIVRQLFHAAGLSLSD
jgi:hypothetical protein